MRERFRREVATAIAAAAEAVFAEEGVHSAHVGHIAKRAGVAVGTLYNHFEDRDALLAALLRERGEELASAFRSAIGSSFCIVERADTAPLRLPWYFCGKPAAKEGLSVRSNSTA